MSEYSDDWTSVKSSVSRKTILEADLVLNSMGISTRVEKGLFEWRLLTRSGVASHARFQLDLYYRENKDVPREHEVLPTLGGGFLGVGIYLAVLWLFFLIDHSGMIVGFGTGALLPSAVQDGAWWLTITALTLHVDLAHIVANSVSGGFFGYILSRYLGNGFAWLMMLVCGAIGNFFNAWIRSEDVYVLGASTACFAGAGLIAGFVWRKSFIRGASVRLNYLPIAAAVGIFIFMGVSGEGTDVLGHLMGLVAGLVGGAILGLTDLRRLGKSGQKVSAYLCIVILVGAWYMVV